MKKLLFLALGFVTTAALAQVSIEPLPDAVESIPAWALLILQYVGNIPAVGQVLLVVAAWVPAMVAVLTALAAAVKAVGSVLAAMGRVAGWAPLAAKIDAITEKAFKVLGYASMFNIQKKQ